MTRPVSSSRPESRIAVLLTLLAACGAASAADQPDRTGGIPESEPTVQTRLIGRAVADFTLKDERGQTHSLADVSDQPVVVLAFLGTECPLAKLYGPRLAELDAAYRDRGVRFFGINSNRQDSVTEIAAYARRHGLQFPVLKDLSNRVADQIGVTRTPEVVVLDAARTIRYHGRIDDQYAVGTVRQAPGRQFLREAIDDLLAGRSVAMPETEPVGCLIGRVREPKSDSPVSYSNQIARILQRHCVECHRDGEIAPFALTRFDEVAGWGEMIQEVVREQRMPPWHASPEHGRFANARVLSADERAAIDAWVAAGCPEGDPAQLPEPREFTSGWQLPREPDLIIPMRDRPFDVPAEGSVRYQYFQVDPGFTQDRWIQAAELQPGNRAVVHHILLLVLPPEGRRGDGTIGEFLAAYVPGYRTPVYPEGMAKHVPAGSKLVFQMHYTPVGSAQQDLSRLGLLFEKPESVTQVVVTQNAVARRFEIPPHADNHPVTADSRRAPVDVQLLTMMPHMHLRGKSFRYEARYPDGRTEVLLDVPRYDFNWQTAYRLAEPLTLPRGAFLHCLAHFDNSADNLNNPDPSQTVRWGEQTWEEMMIGYFDVAIPRSVFGLKDDPAAARSGPAGGSSPAEPAAGTVRIGGREFQPGALQKAFADLDKDGDGRLRREDVPDRGKSVFDRLDTNGDGLLTRAEAREAILTLISRPQGN